MARILYVIQLPGSCEHSYDSGLSFPPPLGTHVQIHVRDKRIYFLRHYRVTACSHDLLIDSGYPRAQNRELFFVKLEDAERQPAGATEVLQNGLYPLEVIELLESNGWIPHPS